MLGLRGPNHRLVGGRLGLKGLGQRVFGRSLPDGIKKKIHPKDHKLASRGLSCDD